MSIRIETPGNYLARDGKTVAIVRIDRTTAVGRHPDTTEALVWDVSTGEAIGHDLSHSLVEKTINIGAIAANITKMLMDLPKDSQRSLAFAIIRGCICIYCGAITEPGTTCPCQSPPKPGKSGGKAGRKGVK